MKDSIKNLIKDSVKVATKYSTKGSTKVPIKEINNNRINWKMYKDKNVQHDI